MATEARIIPFDSLRAFSANELARNIRDVYDGPREFFVGTEGFALDLSAMTCSLCGGRFAPIGRAMFVQDHHGEVRYLHTGCTTTDLEAWINEPEDAA